MPENRLAELVESNPRLLGALFAASLVLLQAQSVAANAADIIVGP